ncbi:MAG: hypothetical protein FWH48_00075 [Oscillospiraceae bacterium]|nr:hypothetical protein [Oscillospiraceae bacterium]
MAKLKKSDGSESGYITVETLMLFVPFALVMISILSLVNIITVQLRLHHALAQAANTVSIYSYALSAPDAADNIQALLDGIDRLSFRDAAIYGEAARERADGSEENIANYPAEMIYIMIEDRDIYENLVLPLLFRYLGNGAQNGDEYLKWANVVGGIDGLEFLDAGPLIDSNGDVTLAICYEIEYRFGPLPLPFGPRLEVVQYAKTKAWQNGAGEGYDWGDGS